jgi:hypothetical protein
MKQIPIQHKPELFALVDDDDFDLVSQYKWYAVRTSKRTDSPYYAYANVVENGKKTTIAMHTLLMNPTRTKGQHVDHCPDPNGLNNCRDNLTLCTPGDHRRRHADERAGYRKDISGINSDMVPRKTKKPRRVNKMLRFTGDEFQQLEDCAKAANLPLAVWSRKVLIDAATKPEAERQDEARMSWAKKVINNRTKQLKEIHVHE